MAEVPAQVWPWLRVLSLAPAGLCPEPDPPVLPTFQANASNKNRIQLAKPSSLPHSASPNAPDVRTKALGRVSLGKYHCCVLHCTAPQALFCQSQQSLQSQRSREVARPALPGAQARTVLTCPGALGVLALRPPLSRLRFLPAPHRLLPRPRIRLCLPQQLGPSSPRQHQDATASSSSTEPGCVHKCVCMCECWGGGTARGSRSEATSCPGYRVVNSSVGVPSSHSLFCLVPSLVERAYSTVTLEGLFLVVFV